MNEQIKIIKELLEEAKEENVLRNIDEILQQALTALAQLEQPTANDALLKEIDELTVYKGQLEFWEGSCQIINRMESEASFNRTLTRELKEASILARHTALMAKLLDKCKTALSKVKPSVDNREFKEDISAVEYYTWNCTKLDDLVDNEQVQIKTIKGNLFTTANWSKEDSCFYAGWEAEFKPHEVKFRKIFPDNIFERAARDLISTIKE